MLKHFRGYQGEATMPIVQPEPIRSFKIVADVKIGGAVAVEVVKLGGESRAIQRTRCQRSRRHRKIGRIRPFEMAMPVI